jgi:hypothetical protein
LVLSSSKPVQSGNFSGLENLETIERSFFISYNYYIKNFEGLNKLKSIGLALGISAADELESFTGLDSVESIGQIILNSDQKLENFSGLESLKYLKGLEVNHLSDLNSLNGLNALNSITEYIQFWDNDLLNDLSALENVDLSILTSLSIYGNEVLSECSIRSICDYLDRFGTHQIYENNPGCNSSIEVMEGCLVSTDIIDEKNFSFFPNPTSGILESNMPTLDQYKIQIFDCNGRLVQGFQLYKNIIDATDLSHGMYIIAIRDGNEFRYYSFFKHG